jgi:hypothetical protein
MTPQEYVAQIEQLVAAARDREALELAARVGPSMRDALSAEQFHKLGWILESAVMAVDLEDWEAQQHTAQSAP